LDELEKLNFSSDDFNVEIDQSQGKGTVSLKNAGSGDENIIPMVIALG